MRDFFTKLLAPALVLVFFGFPGEIQAADEGKSDEPVQVGEASRVSRLVNGRLGEELRSIPLMGKVYQDEVIETGAASGAEIRFLDHTKLTIGPKAKLTLDKFVFDPQPDKGKMVINATKGVFRFVSGRLSSNAYQVKTPVATMGVRGTAFTVIVEDDGATTVSVTNGTVSVANVAGDDTWVKPGMTTRVAPQPPSAKAPPPPAPPIPTPPSVDKIIGDMDKAVSESPVPEGEAAEAEEEGAQEEVAEGEAVEGDVELAEGEGELTEEEDAAIEAALEASDIEVPEDVIAGLLDGSEEGLAALKAFLAALAEDPATLVGGADAILQALEANAGAAGAEALLSAYEAVSTATGEELNALRSQGLGDEDLSKAGEGAIALDFGSADSVAAEGFEKVTDKDARLVGDEDMSGMRSPDGNPLLGSGIKGLRGLNFFDLAKGFWRLRLMAGDFGDDDPFGDTITINNVKYKVVRGVTETGARYIEVEIPVDTGQLKIELAGKAGKKVVLSAMTLTPIKESRQISRRLLYEGLLADRIAGLLGNLATAAGEEDVIEDLPEVIPEPPDGASPA